MLLEIPKRLREHAERLRQQADEEFEALRALDLAAATACGTQLLQETLTAEQEKLDEMDEEIERAEQKIQTLQQEQAAFASGQDEHFRQAVEFMSAEFQDDGIIALRREAQATPTPEDDLVIDKLIEIEHERTQLEESLRHYQQLLRTHQQRLGELEGIRREFKRQRYDDVHSTFADGALMGMMLNEFLGGLLSSDKLWRTIQRQQRNRRIRSNPTFGSGGFGRRGGIWSSGGSGKGGGFGGGGFRTGGSFDSGGGFRTGGSF